MLELKGFLGKLQNKSIFLRVSIYYDFRKYMLCHIFQHETLPNWYNVQSKYNVQAKTKLENNAAL